MNKVFRPSFFHRLEPDYSRPLFRPDPDTEAEILFLLKGLYGAKKAAAVLTEVKRIMAVYYAHKTDEMILWERDFDPSNRLSEKDVILITYGDLIVEEERKPLKTLAELSRQYLRGVFNTIHILPFFPSSSDRGFAIRDFKQVDPNLGSWDDINDLKDDFKLMFDGVFNHVSSKSFWFQEFLNGNPDYNDYFTAYPAGRAIPEKKLKMLLRPRTSDVLTPFYSIRGKELVWTTFSPDQIDLKFQNPRVLIRILDILLYYVRRGADFVRLDAVTYLWDQLGTTGAHLGQTHAIIRLFRVILDAVAPHVALVSETNVPHCENISYFGSGADEAQLVYNFALPPLILHALHTGGSDRLSRWAAKLENPSPRATFLNFLDSHDGIGIMGARGILSVEEIDSLRDRVLENGGFVSYKKEKDGSQSVYELNITSFSALNREEEDQALQINRYMAARSIPLVLIGVPGVYLHGLLGSRNDIEAVIQEDDKRSINRDVLSRTELVAALEDRCSTTSLVSRRLSSMIHKRIGEKAFHPHARQRVVDLSPSVFSLLRFDALSGEEILALTNVANTPVPLTVDGGLFRSAHSSLRNIINGMTYALPQGGLRLILQPYEVMWLKGEKDRELA
ncbi:MAG TPA: sugar phosphorylase [Spirochaetota bacterium]|nr:sugar phosphorylase [Spirochaetota bacterium]HPR49859.1 sugar phosphorylase [Spirochaetota bacterium]